MLRRINKVQLGITLIIIVGIIYYFNEIKVQSRDIPLTNVVIAKENIQENTIITQDLIETVERYTDDLMQLKGYITGDESKILGKLAVSAIYKNEPVVLNRLTEAPEERSEDGIARTYFAMKIESDTDRSLRINKNSKIDIWRTEIKSMDGGPKNSLLWFEGLEVVDYFDENYDKANRPIYLVFYLSDAEIEKINSLDRDVYNLKLALHNPTDKKESNLKTVEKTNTLNEEEFGVTTETEEINE